MLSLVILNGDKSLEEFPIDSFQLQNRGGKGRQIHEGTILGVADLEGDINFLTNTGRVLTDISFLEDNEVVIAMLNEEGTAFLISKKGTAKRIQLDTVKRPKKIMELDDDDELVQIKFTSGDDELLIITAQGQGLRVHEDEFRVMGMNGVKGVRAIALDEGDYVTDCEVITPNKNLFLLSEYGIGKIVEHIEFSIHHRKTRGVSVMRALKNAGILKHCKAIRENDDVLIWTKNNRVIRLSATEIPLLKRISSGNRLINVQEDEVKGVYLDEN